MAENETQECEEALKNVIENNTNLFKKCELDIYINGTEFIHSDADFIHAKLITYTDYCNRTDSVIDSSINEKEEGYYVIDNENQHIWKSQETFNNEKWKKQRTEEVEKEVSNEIIYKSYEKTTPVQCAKMTLEKYNDLIGDRKSQEGDNKREGYCITNEQSNAQRWMSNMDFKNHYKLIETNNTNKKVIETVEKPQSVEININAKGQMSGKVKVYAETIEEAMKLAKENSNKLLKEINSTNEVKE